MKQLLPSEFRDTLPLAVGWDTALLWLWALPDVFGSYAPTLGAAFDFAVDRTGTAVRIDNVASHEVWIAGQPEACRAALGDALEFVEDIHIDNATWEHEALDDLRAHWQVCARARHFRSAPTRSPVQRRALGFAAARATRSDMAQLRALDTQQYGRLLDGVDYPALVASGVSWVVRRDRRIVGSALVNTIGDWDCLSSLWTDPGYRRLGAAQQLMVAVIADGAAHSRWLALNVDATNRAACALYTGLQMQVCGGFVTLGRIGRSCGDDPRGC